MQRRGFLSLLGSAALAPVLPALPGAAPVAQVAAKRAGYSGLLYGMAKFHAQTRASLTAADLMPRLGVSAAKAQALIAELTAKGVLSPMAVTAARSAATEAVTEAGRTAPNTLQEAAKERLTSEMKQIADVVAEEATPSEEPTETDAEETQNGKV